MIEETISPVEILEAIKIYSEHVDQRFDQLELRLDRIEQRLDRVEERLDRIEVRLDSLERNTVTKRQFNSLLFVIEDEGVISNDQTKYIQEQ